MSCGARMSQAGYFSESMKGQAWQSLPSGLGAATTGCVQSGTGAVKFVVEVF